MVGILYNEITSKPLFDHELVPVAICIFLVGLIGFLESRNFLAILINIELMMLGINFYFITYALIFGSYEAQVMALCFLALTAAETVIGLGLLIIMYRVNGSVRLGQHTTFSK